MNTEIHSFESFGTVDGPGIRFVVFFQGCMLRCLYCHNPDTWRSGDGKRYDTQEIVEQIKKYRSYFKNEGGVTVSGGDPLFQIDALIELLTQLKKLNIHTCVDTSGALFDKDNPRLVEKFDQLRAVTDLFLLDIKHINDEEHKKLTGMSNQHVLSFARYLSEHNHPMWIRHVLVPGITNDETYLKQLRVFLDCLSSVQKVEVLPYHTMGSVKYENLGYTYALKDVEAPSKEDVRRAKEILCNKEDAS